MDLRLESFLAIIREGSYVKAAKSLSLSQPSVTYHIRQLEREYGIKIFYRNGNAQYLTGEGKILLQYAQRLENLENRLRRELTDAETQLTHLTVGITPTCSEALLGRVFTSYCSAHPETSIRVVTGSTEQLVRRIEDYALDFALLDGTVESKSCRVEHLDTDYLLVVMCPQHPLACRDRVTLEELKKESLILRSDEAGTRRLFEAGLIEHIDHIHNYDVRLEMDDLTSIKELVMANLGVTIMAYSACREEIQAGRLYGAGIEGMNLQREIQLVSGDAFDYPSILAEIRRLYESLTQSALSDASRAN